MIIDGLRLVVYVTLLMAWAGTGQLTVAVMVLAMFFPCVATFVVLWKELGWMDLLRIVLIMFISSLAVGTILNIVF